MGGKKFTITAIGTFFVLFFSYIFLLSQFSWKNTVPTHAAVKSWSGGATGVWENGANWSPAGVPTSADDVTISGTAEVTLSLGQTADFNSLTIGPGTDFNNPAILYLEGNIGAGGSIVVNANGRLVQKNTVQQIISGDLIINALGRITHFNNTSAHNYEVDFKAQNITIADSSSVTVSGLGFQPTFGSSPGQNEFGTPANGAGGGAHGGGGGNGTSALGGTAYCNINNISTIGSGGGLTSATSSLDQSQGGGLLILEAIDTLTINENISASGLGAFNLGKGAGGGGGGGVRLKANTIASTASPHFISATGGSGNNSGDFNGYSGGGGGGCISITYTSASSITLSDLLVSGGGRGTLNPFSTDGSIGLTSLTQIGPNPPTSPTLNSISTSSAIFSWTSGSGSETFFLIDLSTNGGGFATIATTSATSSNYTLSGLLPNNQYAVRIAASTGFATSSFATSSGFYTLALPVSSVSLSNPSTSTISLNFSVPGSNPTSTLYAFYDSINNIYLSSLGTPTASPTFSSFSSTTINLSGLTSNTTYQFVGISRNGGGVNSSTSSLSNSTTTLINIPGAPTVSSTTSTNSLAVSLSPNNNSFSTTYALYTLPTNTYLTSSGLAAGGPTYFSTSSWNGYVFGLSPNSPYQFLTYTSNGLVSNTSTAVYTAASVPASVLATVNSGSQITISWSGDATNYFVENVTAGTNSGWVSGSSTVFSGLQCGNSYDFRVKGRNNDLVETGFSSTISAFTPSCPSGASGGGSGVGYYFLPPPSSPAPTPLPPNPSAQPPSSPSTQPADSEPLSPAFPSTPLPTSSKPNLPSPTISTSKRFDSSDLTFFAPGLVSLSQKNNMVDNLSCITTTAQISLKSLPIQPRAVQGIISSSSNQFAFDNKKALIAYEVSEKGDFSSSSDRLDFSCTPSRTFDLTFNKKDQTYIGSYVAPTGIYSASFVADYAERRDETATTVLKISSPGTISTDSSDVSLSGAEVTLLVPGGKLAVSAAHNPQISFDGLYGFVVPSSTQLYYLEIVTKDNRLFRTEPFLPSEPALNHRVLLSTLRPSLIPRPTSSSSSPPASKPSVISPLTPLNSVTGLFTILALGGFFAQIPLPILSNLLRLFFFQPLRGRRKELAFGIVYNSLSKQPIPLALVRLIDLKENRLLQSRVTDEKGRFFLHAPPGNYRIEVTREGMFFPSNILKGLRSDGKHEPLYHGEQISVSDKNPLLSVHIPLDPPGTAKTASRLYREKIFKFLQITTSLLGITGSAVLIALNPFAYYQWAIFAINVALFVIFWFLSTPKKPNKWGVVYNVSSKKPINRAVARLFNTEFNKLVDSQITDPHGRYFFFAGGSNFRVTAEHPEFETTTSEEISLKDKEQAVISAQVNLKKKI